MTTMRFFGLSYFAPWLGLGISLAAVASTGWVHDALILNAVLQLVLFVLVAHIPTQKTKRMSYVDIAWPWGLVVIGVVAAFMQSSVEWRGVLILVVYGGMGGRTGIRSVRAVVRGAFAVEFPRYEYQKLRWTASRKANRLLAMHIDVSAQAFLNIALLCLPAFLFTLSPATAMHPLEVVGLAMWLIAFLCEWVADRQKASFTAAARARGEPNAVCNIGFWRYSRHPNYFFEWMVWNALILASIPGYIGFWWPAATLDAALIGAVLLYTSFYMLRGLLYGTGAEPSEYYSMKRRPAYADYRKQTNRFVPWPHARK